MATPWVNDWVTFDALLGQNIKRTIFSAHLNRESPAPTGRGFPRYGISVYAGWIL